MSSALRCLGADETVNVPQFYQNDDLSCICLGLPWTVWHQDYYSVGKEGMDGGDAVENRREGQCQGTEPLPDELSLIQRKFPWRITGASRPQLHGSTHQASRHHRKY